MRAEPRQDLGSAPTGGRVSEDLVQVATEFVYQLLRTSPGHLDTLVGKRLLDALDFTRSEGVTDTVVPPKDSGGGGR